MNINCIIKVKMFFSIGRPKTYFAPVHLKYKILPLSFGRRLRIFTVNSTIIITIFFVATLYTLEANAGRLKITHYRNNVCTYFMPNFERCGTQISWGYWTTNRNNLYLSLSQKQTLKLILITIHNIQLDPSLLQFRINCFL